MYQITLNIDGMMCAMCESHVNDAVRNAFPVKKVTSSHSRGETGHPLRDGDPGGGAAPGLYQARLRAHGLCLRPL